MGVKVIIHGFDSYTEVVRNLVTSGNWEPCYWIAPMKSHAKMKEVFPNIVLHDTNEAIVGIVPKEFKKLELRPLDHSLLKDLAYHESMTLQMMDRMDPYKVFTYHERIELYYLQLRYWLTILEVLDPEIVLFQMIPHFPDAYVLYILSRWKGIKTILFRFTSFIYISIPMDNYEDELPAVALYKKLLAKGDISPVLLSAKTEQELERKRATCYEDVVPPRYLHITKHLIKKSDITERSFLKTCYEYLWDFYVILRSIKHPPRPHFVKRKGKKLQDFFWLRYKYELYKFKFKCKKLKLALYYEDKAEVPDLKCKFIYVPLHYQPEMTTCPQGGFYTNQELMIEVLSKSVPEDWMIYVKEHIIQFSRKLAGECSRSYGFYDKIVSLPNVKLVSFKSLSTFDLIDNAKAVAIISGTAGFEAILRGTPTITFGYAWYNGCEGVFYVPSYEECKKVINEIENGFVVDYEKVRLFIYALEKTGFNLSVLPKEEKYTGISYKENVRNLTRALQEICRDS